MYVWAACDGYRYIHVSSGTQVPSFAVRDVRIIRKISITIFESSCQGPVASMDALGLRKGHNGQ